MESGAEERSITWLSLLIAPGELHSEGVYNDL